MKEGARSYYYRVVPSSLGDMGIVWLKRRAPLIVHIILPKKDMDTRALIDEEYPDTSEDSDTKIDEVCDTIRRYIVGERVSFSLALLDMDRCYDFQKRVLSMASEIPRGRVVTYGRLAEKITAACAARAVGTALARNPFPIIIPCHRVVKASRYPGRFGGGDDMKVRLLKTEGVLFDQGGKIEERFFW